MDNKITLQVTGMDDLIARLRAASKDVDSAVDETLSAAALDIVELAVKKVPRDTGTLANRIGADINGDVKRVYANAAYAAYVEFGTGALVDIPTELKEYAEQFRGKGIRQVNLPARPYFFPAVFKVRAELPKRFRAVAESLLKSA